VADAKHHDSTKEGKIYNDWGNPERIQGGDALRSEQLERKMAFQQTFQAQGMA
jgi:hypothetical protein